MADFGVICIAGLVAEGGKPLINDLSVERACPYLIDIGLSAVTILIPY